MPAPQTDKKLVSQADVLGPATPWYKGVAPYQWLILIIASAGWVFDAFEGQIFNITRNQLLADILHVAGNDPSIKRYGDIFLAIFLVGGTVGGLLFGSLADKWGRRPTMAITILMYSIFSGLTFFADNLWEVAALRFLVAMGVGGEWAVAASLVAEIFPPRARAHASGIFHATSVLGTWFAALAGMAVAAQWRYAYLIGIIPALLTLWVRAKVKEPESWKEAGTKAKMSGGPQMGSFRDLLLNPRWRGRAFLGMLLAAVGLGSFWGVTVAGQDLAKELLLRKGVDPAEAAHQAKFAYGIVQTVGAGLGLLAFGPLCVKLGRKRAFAWMHIGAFIIVPITCYLPQTYTQLLLVLPVFGFLTLGIHAGYAIYFPELFPNHLRATGTGFCFNGGRILAASVLIFSGWVKSMPGMDLRLAITLLGLLFPLGLIVIYFLPETKNQPLPE
ncbi:MAG: major facilitator superfamily 1 [Pedosphaera sp.]|nr:major facilitator superfamily 1 [Pedosphaera sp.]